MESDNFEKLKEVGELGEAVPEYSQGQMTVNVLGQITGTNVNDISRVPLRKPVMENASAFVARCQPTLFPFGLGDVTDEDTDSPVGREVPFSILHDSWTVARRLLWFVPGSGATSRGGFPLCELYPSPKTGKCLTM